MFWRFGGYANISTLDTILDKPDVTLEELLDESDLIQELKQHNAKLIEYLRDENVLRRLLRYVVAPKAFEPDDDDGAGRGHSRHASALRPELDESGLPKGKSREHELSDEERDKEEKQRLKYAYIACEVLSSETWSISEALMENQEHLRHFWRFLRRRTPLDPLQAGYFTKVNETLLDKKTEEMLDFYKSLDGVVPDMLHHVDCPMVMDLLLKIISLEKVEGGQGIVDWLHSQDLIPILLSYLSVEHSSATQTSAGDFLKAIITISANASQNEQSCIGPNGLTRQLVSERCVRSLTVDMLRGGNPLTVGVGIIIEVIRKNNSDYDPDVGAGAESAPSSRDPIYLGTLLRIFAQHVPDFMTLILSPTYNVINDDGTVTVKKRELKAAFGEVIEPLGFDRFKTCELMAELLHCSNMGLLNERGSESFVKERDRERARLKAAGAVHGESQAGEAGAGSRRPATPSALGSGSPEEIRKLEVANGGEEDGFEDVTVSGVLNDEVKDDFDEKPEMEREDAKQGPDPPDDGEFVDEPLSSPRLNVRPEHEAVGATRAPGPASSSEAVPLSPTSAGLTARIDGLGLDHENDTIMGASSDSGREGNEQQMAQEALGSATEPTAPAESLTSPAAMEAGERRLSQGRLSADALSRARDLEGMSPHAEDEPAPLFSARKDETPRTAEEQDLYKHEAGNRDSQETIDTTLAEEGNSSRSVLMGNEANFEAHFETDIDGSPVVGDYLKMMFVEHRVVPTILDFFFRFPWNNFLHNVVYDVVQQVFNGPMDRGYNRTLAIDLFDTGRITERIVEGQRRSDKAQAEANMRLGYMGHLTLIAEEVVKFTERHPPEFLSKSVLDRVMHADWIDYVERTLAETRERDNAILGGVRPDISVGPRQAVINSLNAAQGFGNGPSAALANAGLTGSGTGLDSFDLANGGNHSGGSFNLNSGSLLSGFGSSSDEEDEEMDEINEDMEDAGEQRAAQSSGRGATGSEQLTSFVGSLATTSQGATLANDENAHQAPSAPSPQPLNIPPSRARRQLAARLAMSKKKKEDDDRRRLEGKQSQGAFGIGPLEHDEEGEGGAGGVWGVSGGGVKGGGVLQSPHSSDDDDEDEEEAVVPRRARKSPERQRTTAAATRSVLEVDDDEEGMDEAGDDDADDEGADRQVGRLKDALTPAPLARASEAAPAEEEKREVAEAEAEARRLD
ncbi:MAG: hypothetical protein M1832_001187 [Thelocarpon impressellum]|nr:MAG: hypothetical protein M1832_001187 [Thelocarpon impressellum]